MDNRNTQMLFSKNEFTILAEELSLSPREVQIIDQMLCGNSDKQIAKNLKIAVPTVRTYMQRLFVKLNARDKYELLVNVFSASRKLSNK
jgi:DNA-binding NarL/FixJ family response regulator